MLVCGIEIDLEILKNTWNKVAQLEQKNEYIFICYKTQHLHAFEKKEDEYFKNILPFAHFDGLNFQSDFPCEITNTQLLTSTPFATI